MLYAKVFDVSKVADVGEMDRLLERDDVAFGTEYMKVVGDKLVIFYAPKIEQEKKVGEEGYTFGLQKPHILEAIDKFMCERQSALLTARLNLANLEREDARKQGGKERQQARWVAMNQKREEIRVEEGGIETAQSFIDRVNAGENILAISNEFGSFSYEDTLAQEEK